MTSEFVIPLGSQYDPSSIIVMIARDLSERFQETCPESLINCVVPAKESTLKSANIYVTFQEHATYIFMVAIDVDCSIRTLQKLQIEIENHYDIRDPEFLGKILTDFNNCREIVRYNNKSTS